LKIIVESKQESVSRTCEESEIKRGGNVWCSWRGTAAATLEEGGGEDDDAALVLKPAHVFVVRFFFPTSCLWRFVFPRMGRRKKARREIGKERALRF
jgi:hypothetical protein